MTILLILIRAVHFGSCLILQSVFAVLFLVARPAWNESGGQAFRAWERFHRSYRRLLVIGLSLAFVSGFVWFWLAIVSMSGCSPREALQPELLGMVLTQTEPGHVWLARAGMALALAGVLSFLPGPQREGKSAVLASSLGALLALLLTASLAWLGHAGADESAHQNLQLAGDLLHLIAAGIWPAGLAPLAVFLRCFLKERDPAALQAAGAATRRFSALSLVTVAVLTLSGVMNSYCLVGTFHALVSTEYGRLLMLKLVLFGVTIGIGAWNLKLTPRSALGAGAAPGEGQSAALSKIVRNVWIEIGLVTFILLVVGLLGISPPAVHS